jgi:hypothetical protein
LLDAGVDFFSKDEFGISAAYIARFLAASPSSPATAREICNLLGESKSDEAADASVKEHIPLHYLKKPSERKLLIVVNPVSGSGASLRVLEQIVKPILDLAGLQYEVKSMLQIVFCHGINVSFQKRSTLDMPIR